MFGVHLEHIDGLGVMVLNKCLMDVGNCSKKNAAFWFA